MKTLSYSPYMEAFVAVSNNGTTSYYDISEDIVSGSITRNQDAVSTFSLKLANKGRKYNGVFKPMDRIVISLAKEYGKAKPVLTGYIGKVDAWTLYQSDFEVSGYCSLYRLQRLYWDPGLLESVKLVRGVYREHAEDGDGGMSSVAHAMLSSVGGMPDESIRIEKDIPTSVVEWAKSLYTAKLDDIEQAKDMANQFYSMLAVAGPQMTGGTSFEGGSVHGTKAQKAIVKLYLSWLGKLVYSLGSKMWGKDPLKQSGVASDCSDSCYNAYMRATGINPGGWTGDMAHHGKVIASGSSGSPLPLDKMRPADLVLMGGTPGAWQHVEMYIGNNRLAGHGSGMGPTIKDPAQSGVFGPWEVRRYT